MLLRDWHRRLQGKLHTGRRAPRRIKKQRRAIQGLEPRLTLNVGSPTGLTLPAFTEGTPSGTINVATFSSSDAGPFTASIEWGDGTTTAGTISAGPSPFTVSGSHTYSEDGTDAVSVEITDTSDSTTGTATTSATVREESMSLFVGSPISTTEGVALSGVTVATFQDPGSPDPASSFTATIDWGDGTTTAGAVTGSGGNYTVTGDHTYADELSGGHYQVSIAEPPVSFTLGPVSGNVTVVEADTLTPRAAMTSTTTEGTPFIETATFSTTNSSAAAADFTGTIDWGDGTTTTGIVPTGPTGGPFTISAAHTYGDELPLTSIAVTLADVAPGTATASVSDSVTVGEADALAATATPVVATEGTATPNTVQVATFTTTYAANTAADFDATILWGDGTSSTGTVTGPIGGPFTVTGPAHFYADEGHFTTTVAIKDNAPGTATATATGTATVSEADLLIVSPIPVTATEGTTFSGLVATVTNLGYPSNPAGDFTATVNWGDGTTSQGTVASIGGGNYTVVASHVYADEGTFATSVIIADDLPGTAAAAAASSATVVENDTLTAGPAVTASATEGATFSGTLATFADTTYAANLPADFTASIAWGDSTTSTGTVTGSAGSFTVTGSHAYAEEGTYTPTITLSDNAPGTATQTAAATIHVADAPLTATAMTIGPTEGISFTGVVANFTDADPAGTATDYTAIINWGDGTTTTGTVAPNGSGGFQVTGTHTYAEETGGPTPPFPAGLLPPHTVTVVVSDVGGSTVTAGGTANVQDAALTGTSATVTPTEGATFTAAVATFADANPGGTASDFSATVLWGDGHVSVGTVTGSTGGPFTVTATNTYLEEGTNSIEVVVDDVGGSKATITSTANVQDATLAATVTPITGPEFTPFSGVVATFTDANPNGTLSDFTATIEWGDGTTTTGTVATVPTGGFNVSGSHTYAEDGNFTVSVKVTDVGGSTVVATGTATITEPPLVGSGVSVSGFERSSINNATVATFTHGNGLEPASGFTATIDWGDGTTSAGSVSETSTTYTVVGSHTFFDEHTYPVSVTVNDDTASATIATSAKISEELLPNGTQGTANERFVQEIYRDLFHRQVDTTALPFWSNLLDRGQSRLQVAQAIIKAAMPGELGVDLVNGMYEKFLNRAPDAMGLAFWVGILNGHETIENTEANLVGTDEFFADAGGTNDGFLDRLYTLALGRSPDAGGRAAFDAMLASGVSREKVAEIVFNSHESHLRLVAGYYQSPVDPNDRLTATTNYLDDLDFLDRPVDPATQEALASQMDHGTTDQQIWAMLIATDEFLAKTA